MNVQDIIDVFIGLLGNEYKVINSFNNEEQISLDGVLAVNYANKQVLHNGETRDYKAKIRINGMTLISEDLTQQRINEMFDYAFDKLDRNQIKSNIENCAGVLINGGAIESDGESNNFSIEVQLFICED